MKFEISTMTIDLLFLENANQIYLIKVDIEDHIGLLLKKEYLLKSNL